MFGQLEPVKPSTDFVTVDLTNTVLLTDDELALYHRFLSEGWTDTVNQKRDLIEELSNV